MHSISYRNHALPKLKHNCKIQIAQNLMAKKTQTNASFTYIPVTFCWPIKHKRTDGSKKKIQIKSLNAMLNLLILQLAKATITLRQKTLVHSALMGVLGISSNGVIEWGQKSKPFKIRSASYKILQNSWTKT